MDVLIDTNILVRRINRHDPQFRDARYALKTIEARGDRICIAPQNIIEFWNVATRPADKNGLSLQKLAAQRDAAAPATYPFQYGRRRALVRLLPELPAP